MNFDVVLGSGLTPPTAYNYQNWSKNNLCTAKQFFFATTISDVDLMWIKNILFKSPSFSSNNPTTGKSFKPKRNHKTLMNRLTFTASNCHLWCNKMKFSSLEKFLFRWGIKHGLELAIFYKNFSYFIYSVHFSFSAYLKIRNS